MATHGRTGEDLARYRSRKLRPHVVSGLYRAEGAASKPQQMTGDQYLRKLRLRGTSGSSRRGKGKGGDQAPGPAAAKRSGGVTHYRPVRCAGRRRQS